MNYYSFDENTRECLFCTDYPFDARDGEICIQSKETLDISTLRLDEDGEMVNIIPAINLTQMKEVKVSELSLRIHELQPIVDHIDPSRAAELETVIKTLRKLYNMPVENLTIEYLDSL